VVAELVRAEYEADSEFGGEIQRLARRFKVSTLVILRGIHDTGGISAARLWAEYEAELARLRDLPRGRRGRQRRPESEHDAAASVVFRP
jgi:hypothetical protein